MGLLKGMFTWTHDATYSSISLSIVRLYLDLVYSGAETTMRAISAPSGVMPFLSPIPSTEVSTCVAPPMRSVRVEAQIRVIGKRQYLPSNALIAFPTAQPVSSWKWVSLKGICQRSLLRKTMAQARMMSRSWGQCVSKAVEHRNGQTEGGQC